MKKILITGGAGFIGHHFVDRLLRLTDWQITLIDRLDSSGNLNRLAEIGAAKNPRVKFVYHDLRAVMNDQLMAQVGRHDYIVHMAAGTHVDRSIEAPMEFVLDNVVGTCNILEFARKVGCDKFLYFSTDEVFGPAPVGVRYHEDDRYNSGNPYAATKAGAEELVVSYANTYGVPAMITHTMNVIGERQHPEKFLPMTIAKVLAGEKVTIHADATKTISGSRFYIHASEVARAVHMLLRGLDAFRKGEKFNIVGAEETSNLALAQMVAESVGRPLNYEMTDFHSSRPGHDLRYALNGKKMEDLMAFYPEPIQVSVDRIVEWTQKNPKWMISHYRGEAA